MKRKHPDPKVKTLAAAVASATQPAPPAPPQKPKLTRDQALLNAALGQREVAMNHAVELEASLAVATATIHEQDAVIADLREQLKAHEKSQAPPAKTATAH